MAYVALEDVEITIGSCLLRRGEMGAEVVLSNSKSVSITFPESCVLEQLSLSLDVVAKDVLISAAWGSPDIIGPNSLPVAITNLRKVLELDNIKILNVPRKGYKLELPSDLSCSEQQTSDAQSPNEIQFPKGAVSDCYPTDSSHSLRQQPQVFSLPFLMAWVSCGLSLSVLMLMVFYVALSWVRLDCQPLNIPSFNGNICVVKGDDLSDFSVTSSHINLNPESRYFYSAASGLVELSKLEAQND